jgi:hypothetical protein
MAIGMNCGTAKTGQCQDAPDPVGMLARSLVEASTPLGRASAITHCRASGLQLEKEKTCDEGSQARLTRELSPTKERQVSRLFSQSREARYVGIHDHGLFSPMKK